MSAPPTAWGLTIRVAIPASRARRGVSFAADRLVGSHRHRAQTTQRSVSRRSRRRAPRNRRCRSPGPRPAPAGPLMHPRRRSRRASAHPQDPGRTARLALARHQQQDRPQATLSLTAANPSLTARCARCCHQGRLGVRYQRVSQQPREAMPPSFPSAVPARCKDTPALPGTVPAIVGNDPRTRPRKKAPQHQRRPSGSAQTSATLSNAIPVPANRRCRSGLVDASATIPHPVRVIERSRSGLVQGRCCASG